ncbi:hypothetical protein FB451DRAFT_1394070 [Mycena latifolia]|nr:hypothetical protein FB451DRAFT_1394070 [Mycena latifolia]
MRSSGPSRPSVIGVNGGSSFAGGEHAVLNGRIGVVGAGTNNNIDDNDWTRRGPVQRLPGAGGGEPAGDAQLVPRGVRRAHGAGDVRDVSRVCNAVATGDLTQKIIVPVQGDLMVQLKKVINTMVDNLGHFATEVTRVSRDVGTDVYCAFFSSLFTLPCLSLFRHTPVPSPGPPLSLDPSRLPLPAPRFPVFPPAPHSLPCSRLSSPLPSLLTSLPSPLIPSLPPTLSRPRIPSLRSFLPPTPSPLAGYASPRFYALAPPFLNSFATPTSHVNVEGTWRELTDEINTLAANLTTQVRSIAAVTTAVAKGDLSKQIEVRVWFFPLCAFAACPSTARSRPPSESWNSSPRALPSTPSRPPPPRAHSAACSLCSCSFTLPSLHSPSRPLRPSLTSFPARSLTSHAQVSANGEILDLKNTVNGMVLRLRTLAVEVTGVYVGEEEEGRDRRRGEGGRGHASRGFWLCEERGAMRLMRLCVSRDASYLRPCAIRAMRLVGNQGKLGGEASVPDVEDNHLARDVQRRPARLRSIRGRYMPRT